MSSVMNSAYIVAGSIYVCAWCVTLGGLSGAQHYCEDNAAMFDGVGLEILSPIAGSKCHRYFRFPWLILFASLLPLVMEALSMCKAGCGALGNKLCRIGGGVPLFAALLPLQFVMANVFYNLANAGAMGLLADRVKVVLAGFAITAAMGALMIIISPLCGSSNPAEMKSFTTIAENKPAEGPAVVEWAFTAHGLKKVERGQSAEQLMVAASRKRKRPGEASAPPPPSVEVAPAMTVDFQAWKREVQEFGAQSLGKKDRQSFEQRNLLALGVKAAAAPRMSAKFGIAVAQKAREREAKAEQDLIDAGMLQVKGKGKRKKAAAREASKDRGLDEIDGFTPGMLRIKSKPGNPEHDRGLARLNIQSGTRGRGERGRGSARGAAGGRGAGRAGPSGRSGGGSRGGGRGGGARGRGGRGGASRGRR